MAITTTVVSGSTSFLGGGYTQIEYSVTFDTAYPTSGGEAWDLSATFPNKVRHGIVTKPPQASTGVTHMGYFAPGTAGGPTNCAVFAYLVPTARGELIEASTTTDMSGYSMRVLVSGY